MPTVEFIYNSIVFEWDSDKKSRVWEKHGISFEEACSVFSDILEKTFEDSRFAEVRYVTIGMSNQARLLTVAWTARGENIRLITAMKAEKIHEQKYHA